MQQMPHQRAHIQQQWPNGMMMPFWNANAHWYNNVGPGAIMATAPLPEWHGGPGMVWNAQNLQSHPHVAPTIDRDRYQHAAVLAASVAGRVTQEATTQHH